MRLSCRAKPTAARAPTINSRAARSRTDEGSAPSRTALTELVALSH
jgi:hypothetical protein